MITQRVEEMTWAKYTWDPSDLREAGFVKISHPTPSLAGGLLAGRSSEGCGQAPRETGPTCE
jgi:hypothetical protein